MIKSKATLFALRRNIDSLLAGAIGFYIIYLFTRHSGIGVSPDAVSYLSAARNFLAGKGFVQFDQLPLVDFPLGYPLFLSAISFLSGLDPLVFAPVMNGLLFALLLYVSGSMMNGFSTPSKWYKWTILSCFVLSPCILEVYPMLWSETVFLVLVIFYILSLTHYFQTHAVRSLWMAAAVAALACVTRYAGVSLIGTGGLLIIFDLHLRSGKRLAHLVIFTLTSCSLLALNLIRNSLVTGFSTGLRQKGTTPWMDNIAYYGSVLCDWLPLEKNNPRVATVVGSLAIAFLLILTVMFIVNRSYPYSYEKVATSFSLVYSLFIVVSATVSRYQQLNSRLLSPLFIPFIWSISFWLPPLIRRLLGWQRVLILVIAIAFAVGMQYNQLTADYETYDGVKDAGVPGYTEDPVPQYQIVQFIQKNDSLFRPGYPVYSNAADAVYFFTGRTAKLLPQKAFPAMVNAFYAEKHHYLIWFNDPEIINPDEVSLQEILQHKLMVLLFQFPEGAVYVCVE
ncbi:MAG TPA: hypothetical protein VK543_17840 [Puia sp.]|nr:hypothetical protein [Puia sp.]